MRDRLMLAVRQAVRRHVSDALHERGLIRGMRIEFPRPGQCRLRVFEDIQPGAHEIVVETALSLISTGTERALYLGLENVTESYPLVPGYSQVGRVVAAGAGSALHVGQLVATPGPHASLYRCSTDRAFLVSRGVSPEHAAMVPIAFIALQGVRKAGIEPGERVLVLGSGLIGLLAAQFAQIAGGQVVVASRSAVRLEVARACGVRNTLNTRAEPDALAGVAAEVVIDATGHPEAVHDACAAAAVGGRVVLLGSSRGTTRDIDLAAWQRKAVTLLGAHAVSVPRVEAAPRAWTWRRECETALQLIAQQRLVLDPLITRRASPGEAPHVYADLAKPDDKSVAILFDWSLPGPWTARIEAVSPLRVAVAGVRRVLRKSTAPSPAFRPRRQDGRVIRFGLVGCGEIAVASAAALRAAANTTITFTADPDIELARSLAAATGAHFTSRVEELLASPEVDAVLISTPHHLHTPLAIEAAEAGKHIVVEKPMATNVADCDRMIATAERCGVVLSVCYCQRFDPRVQRAKELLDAGAIGAILGTRILFGQYRDETYFQRGTTGRTTSDWRSRRETAGGGVLIMNACHILDYMCWLVGSEISEVTALTATTGEAIQVEDTVSMSYRYMQGAMGTLDATTSLVGPDVFEQTVRGHDGQLVVAPVLKLWSRHTVEGYESGRWHTVGPLSRPAERRHFFEAFADAILEERRPPVTGQEGRAVQAVIEAAYESAERKQTVVVSHRGSVAVAPVSAT